MSADDTQSEAVLLVGLGVAAVLLVLRARQTPLPPHTGIDGVVTEGPMCPVESAAHPCPDQPLAGAPIGIWSAAGEVARTETDGGGHFQVRLPPGAYQVAAGGLSTGPGLPRPPAPVAVRVMAGVFTPVHLSYDTGIR